MDRHCALTAFFLSFSVVVGTPFEPAWSDDSRRHEDQQEVLEQAKRAHRGHDHAHDFDAMDDVSAADMQRVMALMMDVGLMLPPMDSHRGRELFVNTGCVVCHSVNGVGGEIAPSLNASDMPVPMNAFEFAARMWRSAPAMVAMQQDFLGQVISLSGQDLADLVAFAHDEAEQAELEVEQIPEGYRELIGQ